MEDTKHLTEEELEELKRLQLGKKERLRLTGSKTMTETQTQRILKVVQISVCVRLEDSAAGRKPDKVL